MKYLKRFNEELDSSTYLSAGNKLKLKGHDTRGQELIDYSKRKNENIQDEFNFYYKGEKLAAKWNYEKEQFETTDGKKISISCEDGDACKVVYRNRPIMTGESYPNVYVSTRQEAIKLLNFIKTIKRLPSRFKPEKYPKLNDLYRENIDKHKSSLDIKPEMEDSFTHTEEKPKVKKRWWQNFGGGTSSKEH